MNSRANSTIRNSLLTSSHERKTSKIVRPDSIIGTKKLIPGRIAIAPAITRHKYGVKKELDFVIYLLDNAAIENGDSSGGLLKWESGQRR